MKKEPSRRLFFALWPDDDVRSKAYALARAVHAMCGGRMMREENMHLTLAFLGAVPLARVDAALHAAQTVAAPPFDWALDRLGSFRRIAWLSGDAPPALLELAAQLRERLRHAGFALEERAFAAHLTLARDARCELLAAVPPAAPIAWRVDDFALVESLAAARGVRYEVIARWPLGESGSASRATSPPPSRGSRSR